MRYIVEDHFLKGIPQTILLDGLPSRGIAKHWTAGGPGRQGALDTAQFFIDRADRNASYHELWWWDAATRTFGVLRIVRATRAAHSINPNRPPHGPYEPNAEVRRILGDKVGDPNAACYAVSFAGMPADLEAALRDPEFIAGASRRIRELLVQEDTIRVDRPLFNHGWAQPSTRYDAGERLIPAIYAALERPPQEASDMPTPPMLYVPQLWTAKSGGAELREQADLSAPVIASVPEGTKVLSWGEAAAGPAFRLVVAAVNGVARLLYARRSQIDDFPLGSGRDAELLAGINAVVNRRIEGLPALPEAERIEVPTGITAQQLADATDAVANAARTVADSFKST